MFKYILQRIGAALLTMFLIMSLGFMVIRLMPRNLFENPEVPPDVQKALMDELHLNDPIPVQYFYYMKDIVTEFNFGMSVKLRPTLPVWNVIVERLAPTVTLNFISIFICVPLGLILGTIAALKRNTWIDSFISFMIVIFISVPSFVFASLLQYFLTFKWPIFPTLYDTIGTFSQQLHSMILPIIALSLGPIATIGRYLRGELIENINCSMSPVSSTRLATSGVWVDRPICLTTPCFFISSR